MNGSTSVPMDHASSVRDGSSVGGRTGRRRQTVARRVGLIGGVLVLGAGVAYLTMAKGAMADKARSTLESFKEKVVEQVVGPGQHGGAENATPEPMPSKTPWNGLVHVTAAERESSGFRILTVTKQTEPIKLEIPGRTDYDQTTLTKIRPRFDNTLIEKVYVEVGQAVKKGDPLYEMKSSGLTQAKADCQTKYVQWDHDRKYRDSREPLVKAGNVTQKDWTDTVNDEKKSRVDYLTSRQLLVTYDITNEQIDKLLEGLGDDRKKALEADDNTQDISRMTVLSKHDGIIVERDVVSGNFYDQAAVLFQISPMDKLWVWGDVFEADQNKVHMGQKWTIYFQYLNEEFEGKVESIANGVDPETRTLRIRASIPNPGKNLKARLLARATLQIKPQDSDTVIPRNAMIVNNGDYYAFVEVATNGDKADMFERRKLEIEQEDHDVVIVKKGLNTGDRVVSNGSLILAQMYEDQSTVDSGMPRP